MMKINDKRKNELLSELILINSDNKIIDFLMQDDFSDDEVEKFIDRFMENISLLLAWKKLVTTELYDSDKNPAKRRIREIEKPMNFIGKIKSYFTK